MIEEWRFGNIEVPISHPLKDEDAEDVEDADESAESGEVHVVP
jgi:hypothetical protein